MIFWFNRKQSAVGFPYLKGAGARRDLSGHRVYILIMS